MKLRMYLLVLATLLFIPQNSFRYALLNFSNANVGFISMAQKPPTLFLIDSHAQLYRAYHAIRPMFAKDRTPTHAVFGFGNILRSVRTRFKPTLLAAVFDPKGPVKREEEYTIYAEKLGKAFSGYKSHREAMPEDLRPQIGLAFELCEGYGIPAIQLEGYEADDVLATLATLAKEKGIDSVIVSSDKDLLQLVDNQVKVFDPMKDILYDAQAVLDAKGIRPDQIVDWLGFMGDAADNIPGVAGVGEQTAIKLLQTYGSMENVLAHYQKEFEFRKDSVMKFVTDHEADNQKPKEERTGIKPPKGLKVVDAYLFAQSERARASRELATLGKNLPLSLDIEALTCKPPKAAKLAPLLRRLDLNRFLTDIDPAELAAFESQSLPKSDSVASESDTGLFDNDSRPTPTLISTTTGTPIPPRENALSNEKVELHYEIVDTEEKFETFFSEWKQHPRFALATTTHGNNLRAAELVGISISWKKNHAYYVALHGPLGDDKLDRHSTLNRMKSILENPAIEKVGHHLKYDIQIIQHYGVNILGIAFDTLIGGWLLDPSADKLSLNELSYTYLLRRKTESKTLLGTGKEQRTMDLIPVIDVGHYACQEVDTVWQLSEKFLPLLEEADLMPLMREIEVPLIQVLAAMESKGIRVDGDLLRKMSANLEHQLSAQETDIFELAGEKFNINSPRQLGDILFGKLGLETLGKTSTGKNSTSEEVLSQLAKSHDLPRRILEYRSMLKLKNTYLDALPQMISARTGRIHCTFQQTGTETGRISSNDPNLQNIPVRSELGRSIRAAFKAGDEGSGWKILAADYSQIELRILAHYSEDHALMTAFREGLDIHTVVAARLFSVAEKDVSREQRSRAKAVNFGIIYGQSAFGLSGTLDISRTEAQQIINTYFSNHPGVRSCLDAIVAKARTLGYVTTVLGRRRFVNEINALDKANRAFGERLAVNTIFQGSAADLIKKAMIEIQHELNSVASSVSSLSKPTWNANLLLQIHDELLFETPPEEVDALHVLVKNKMESALQLNVPLVVDVGVGDDWLDAKG